MSFASMSNKAIAAEIGQRIEQLRLEQNLTQQQLADEIGISRLSYRKLVSGLGKFENIIALLRALGRIDLLEQFIPETVFSPMQQLKLQGKKRQRASSQRQQQKPKVTDSPDKTEPKLDW